MTGESATQSLTHRDAGWAGVRAVVAGMGVSGFAAADALIQHGAEVVVLDGGAAGEQAETRAGILGILGADVRRGPEHVGLWPADLTEPGRIQLVVTSPGFRPTHPLLTGAADLGIPVWSEVELAWRLQPRVGAAPWLAVTGTNGKTTTVQLAESILRAAGLRAIAAGNVGTPVLDAVQHPEPYDVIAVELSSFQLQHTYSMSPLASCVLNVAPDHLDWHGSFEAYAAAKSRIYQQTQVACIYNTADPRTEQMVADADVIDGCRAIGLTLGTPGLSTLGVVDDLLADRAFIAGRATSAVELGTLADLANASGGDGTGTPAPHLVLDALAAAALTRAAGVQPVAVREGLRAFRSDAHRMSVVTEHSGVLWVDDSKATNPHAAQAALAAYPEIVWIAGGQLKGSTVDDLVQQVAGRLRGVVLLGQDREQIGAAVARHAPEVPVRDLGARDYGDVAALTGLMDEVVGAAAELARPGQVVLLSPAAASLDMFDSYRTRGEFFSAAVLRHTLEGHQP